MSRKIFLCILHGVRACDDYFRLKKDATNKLGFTSHQKCAAAMMMLAYGVACGLVYEYMWMRVSTCLELMYKFCRVVVQVFVGEYLREPNVADTARLLLVNESRGFSGMLGIIDCMH
jgi:hypothetical protein